MIIAMQDNYNAHLMLKGKSAILAQVQEYFSAMDTAVTTEWCTCPWEAHPSDAQIASGACRVCNMSPSDAIHDVTSDNDTSHFFSGKRMRRKDDDETCPLHSRVGMLLYFFKWSLDNADN